MLKKNHWKEIENIIDRYTVLVYYMKQRTARKMSYKFEIWISHIIVLLLLNKSIQGYSKKYNTLYIQ